MSETTSPICGRVVAVCRSVAKGTPKEQIATGVLVAGHGLEQDAHAGGWHRQVSLLSVESVEKMRGKGLQLKWGDFAENITVEGILVYTLPVGTRLLIGHGQEPGAILEVTQIGKECHRGCAIFQQVGECVMPREGIFTRVIRGGAIEPGDEITEYPAEKFVVAVVTASDKGSKGEREDLSGKVLTEMVTAAGGEVVHQSIVPDEKDVIAALLKRLSDEISVDLVLTTGGTGMGPRDVSPDATLGVIDRQVPGIAEAMRMESLKKTPRAMLSRAVAGIRGKTLIVNLPGSPRAVKECLDVIMPALPHGIQIMRSQTNECARP